MVLHPIFFYNLQEKLLIREPALKSDFRAEEQRTIPLGGRRRDLSAGKGRFFNVYIFYRERNI